MALFRTRLTPINDLLPSLMVEVCLVLAPDANFFLDSRKQGLPCWRSLFYLSCRLIIKANIIVSLAGYSVHLKVKVGCRQH